MKKPLIVLVLRGLPGSGKTTWALKFMEDNTGWRRVNKDTLRQMLWGHTKPQGNEKILNTIQEQAILDLLAGGWNVIVDNTNLSPKRLERIQQLVAGGRIQVEVEVKNFFDTPLLTCIERDARREAPVGRKAIYDMYVRFVKPVPVFDAVLPSVYICDIDGTVALPTHRSPFAYDKLGSDTPHDSVIRVVQALKKPIVFVSGRPDTYREQTIEWLNNVGHIPFSALHMRKAGDNRQDAIIKREIYEEHIKDKFNVSGVFDDREQVVWMWRQLGFTVFHVAYGFF